MEESTVSPSPASPTAGEDLCETDVTNVAMHSVTLLICLCGLAGNGAVLWLLKLKSCNIDIFALAFADFLFLLFTVPSALLFLVEDVSCSPIMPLLYLTFLFQLSVLSYYWTLWLLAVTLSSITRKLCRLFCHWDPPRRLLWLLNSAQFWAFFALFTVIPAVTSQCPSHKQEHCQAALASVFAIFLLLFAAPMVISQTIDFIKAKCSSKKQQIETRDIVVYLIVLFSLLLNLWNFLQQLGYIIVPPQVVFLLLCIHSSIKPFIYFLAGRCWRPCSVGSLRLSLQRVFEEPEESTASSNDSPRDTGV